MPRAETALRSHIAGLAPRGAAPESIVTITTPNHRRGRARVIRDDCDARPRSVQREVCWLRPAALYSSPISLPCHRRVASPGRPPMSLMAQMAPAFLVAACGARSVVRHPMPSLIGLTRLLSRGRGYARPVAGGRSAAPASIAQNISWRRTPAPSLSPPAQPGRPNARRRVRPQAPVPCSPRLAEARWPAC
jgi:hypothetical protein